MHANICWLFKSYFWKRFVCKYLNISDVKSETIRLKHVHPFCLYVHMYMCMCICVYMYVYLSLLACAACAGHVRIKVLRNAMRYFICASFFHFFFHATTYQTLRWLSFCFLGRIFPSSGHAALCYPCWPTYLATRGIQCTQQTQSEEFQHLFYYHAKFTLNFVLLGISFLDFFLFILFSRSLTEF